MHFFSLKESDHYKPSANTEEKAIETLSFKMKEIIQNSSCKKEDIIFLCIGSDRYVGDSLGPLVGTMLKEQLVPYRVYGTLEEPVHAFNLKAVLKEVKKLDNHSLIFSIDASLGEKDQVGSIVLKDFEKVLPEAGDYHIKGIVNYIDPLPSTQFLNDTRLFTVMNLAKRIVKMITETVES